LYEFTKAVVKDNADVELFIPKGVEPHDWEPTIKDIERLKGFNILIYNNASFEPYIDSLKSNEDVSKGLTMVEVSNNLIKGNDPHVWLDPLLAKEQVINIMNAIISIDKGNEQYYRSNAESYIKRLEELDKEFKEGLRDCNVRKFITLHAAYAYLAERYNLEMITVGGIEPEHDVSPSKIREVIDTAKSYGVDVVYAEEGLDDRLINALANEIGARVLKLSPIEVADDEGNGYIERMRYNLASLREGLGCR
jgi:zinc transport system substrate-binding protein